MVLETFRGRINKVVMWAIVVLISLTFLSWGISSHSVRDHADTDEVVNVNGKSITKTQVQLAAQRLVELFAADKKFDLSQESQKQFQNLALNQLIEAEVLSQQAIKDGYRIANSAVRHFLLQHPMLQVDGRFSRERLKTLLQTLHYTSEGDFAQDLKSQLLIEFVQNAIVGSEFVLPQEAEVFQKLFFATRQVDFIILQPKDFVASMKPDFNKVQDYYRHHSEQFQRPATTDLEYVRVSLVDIAAKVQKQIDDKAIEQYYHDNAVKSSTSREQIKQLLLQQKAELAFATLKEQLVDLNFTNPSELTTISQKLSLPILQARLNETKDPIIDNVMVKEAAMGDMVFHQKNNSDVLMPMPNELIVLRLKNYQPPQTKPLTEVKAEIEKRLQIDMARDVAAVKGQEILAQLRKGTTPAVIAKTNKLIWKSKTLTHQQETAESSTRSFDDFIWSLPTPHDPDKFTRAGKAMPDGSFVIALVYPQKTNEVPSETTKNNEQNISDNLQKRWSASVYHSYKNELLAEAKIKEDSNKP